LLAESFFDGVDKIVFVFGIVVIAVHLGNLVLCHVCWNSRSKTRVARADEWVDSIYVSCIFSSGDNKAQESMIATTASRFDGGGICNNDVLEFLEGFKCWFSFNLGWRFREAGDDAFDNDVGRV
jgi:hypothetical protein